MSCISAHDPQLVRLADAIAQRVGPQRFHVWFNNSTRLDLKHDGLEIAVPNDFISEWIGTHFTRPIQEAAHEVLGCSLVVRFSVVPQLFEVEAGGSLGADDDDDAPDELDAHDTQRDAGRDAGRNARAVERTRREMEPTPPQSRLQRQAARLGRSADGLPLMSDAAPLRSADTAASSPLRVVRPALMPVSRTSGAVGATVAAALSPRSPAVAFPSPFGTRPRLRHDMASFIVGPSNQLAHTAALYVSEFPGVQYNPLFIHGSCGLGKTHLLQGLCKKFVEFHPTKRWLYMTGEEFTNDFLSALRGNKLDVFRRRMRDLDLLVIDDVHFLGGKKATLEEFLHTFNAIEAMGRQVVMASDNHPKMIEEFGESLINRFVSGMVVRVDPPNFTTRCQILRAISLRIGLNLEEEVVDWIARRVTQNVRELEGAVNRMAAHVKLTGRPADAALALETLGDLDRQMVAPVRPENILQSVCDYFGLEHKDLMSGRRQRTISLARSVAMFLIRKTAKLSFPEIGVRMGKRNHSTVISACRRIERATLQNERLAWTSSVGERDEEARELLQRLEEHSRAMS